MPRLNLGLIYGGRSAEREVSNLSAQAVYQHLDPKKYNVFPVSVTADGDWRILPSGIGLPPLGQEDEMPGSTARDSALLPVPADRGSAQPVSAGGPTPPLPTLDIVLPLIHGTYGEDGSLQGFLELCGIPYVGAGVAGSALGMDKSLMKDVLRAHNVPVVPHVMVRRCDWERDPDSQGERIENEVGYPCFTKPARTGSSVGINKVHGSDELAMGMDAACRYDSTIVVEKGLDVRELECGVIGNEAPEVTVVGEVLPAAEFYDYDAKYLSEDTALRIPAEIDRETSECARDIALRAYVTLRCAGFARVDMFMERQSGQLYLNEINTIPGFTSRSMFPLLWEASGVPFGQLLDRLIGLAQDRYRDEQRNEVTVPNAGLLPKSSE